MEYPSDRKHHLKSFTDPIMQFFEYDHLPRHLQEVSEPFFDLAVWLHNGLPINDEQSVALRKLLEAKDAAVRAALSKED